MLRTISLGIFISVLGLFNLNAQDFDWRSGKIRLAAQGGFSWRTDKIAETNSDALKKYLRELKLGYHLGFDISYFFLENLGLGVRYNKDMYKGTLDDVSIPINEKLILENTSDAIGINFFGPALRFLSNGDTQSLSGSISYGFVTYKNQSTFNNKSQEYEGRTGGVALDLGYEFFITYFLSIGGQLSYFTGVLDRVTYTSGNFTEEIDIKQEYTEEGLNRINISAGLRFYIE